MKSIRKDREKEKVIIAYFHNHPILLKALNNLTTNYDKQYWIAENIKSNKENIGTENVDWKYIIKGLKK